MASYIDLMMVAGHLADLAKKLPHEQAGQAALRRCVSTLYYALFHMLVGEVGDAFAPALRRHVDHRDIKTACVDLLAHSRGTAGPPREQKDEPKQKGAM